MKKKYSVFLASFISVFLVLQFATQPIAQAQIYPLRNYDLISGLPESHVRAIMEDHNSYMWFATEGGVSKFDGHKFTSYSTEHGLLSNNIKFILEDKKKQIWIATRIGVSRYDGQGFHNYTKRQNGLVDNDIICIMEDRRGRLWFGTAAGVSIFDGKTFKNLNKTDGLPSGSIYAIKEDTRGNVWLATSQGVVKYVDNNIRIYTKEQGLPANEVYTIIEDKKGKIWVGTDNGIAHFDMQNNEFVPNKKIEGNSVSSLMLDDKGKLWVGTDDGIFIIHSNNDDNNNDNAEVENLGESNGLASNVINFILQDKNKNYWFGTEAGASKLSNRRFNIFAENYVQKKPVTSILEDKKKNIWFATLGKGLIKFDGKNYITYTTDDGLPTNTLKTLYEDSKGNIWIGTNGEGASRLTNGKFTNFNQPTTGDDYVFSVVEDNEGRIWLGTDGGLWRYDGKEFANFARAEGLADNYVRCSLKDKDENLWFGTYGGLSRYNKSGFQNFTTENGLLNNLVLDIIQDRNGMLWMATENGLCTMKPTSLPTERSCITCYTKKNNLSSQNLWSIVEDNEGDIWVGHRNGIDKFSPKTKNTKHFSYIDGFTLVQTFPNAITKDTKGNIWFGALEGVVKYDPKEDIRNNIPPTTHITSIKLFNKIEDWKKYTNNIDIDFNIPIKAQGEKYDLILPYDKNSLTFEFVGIHFTIPERVKYQYFLEGFDKDWSERADNTVATYTNLQPGNYVFKVKSYNSDGVPNKEYTSFSFKINHPYWEQVWFYAAELAFFVTLAVISLYLGSRRRGARITIVLSLATLFLLFEFVNVYIENYIESILGNIPIYKVVINVLLATLIAPLEHFIKAIVSEKKSEVTIRGTEDQKEITAKNNKDNTKATKVVEKNEGDYNEIIPLEDQELN